MLDELELLKKDWQTKEHYLPKLSYDRIYKMILKKSSSFVKWIFYLSIAEFAFWIVIGLLPIQGQVALGNSRYTGNFFLVLEVLSYLVILFFIVRFYLNFNKIKATANAKSLMEAILETRKTVKQYVWTNLILFAVSFLLVALEIVLFEPGLMPFGEGKNQLENPLLAYTLFFLAVIGTILLFGGIIWLFYRLLYGILLKRLNENYNELKKLEI